RFERPQPNHVVGELGGERALLNLVELDPLLGRDLADQFCDFSPQCGASYPAGDRGVDPRHQGGSDLLLELVPAGKICARTLCRPGGNENELAAARLDDAATKSGGSHFADLRHRRRSEGRPESSSTRAPSASANLPRCAAATRDLLTAIVY